MSEPALHLSPPACKWRHAPPLESRVSPRLFVGSDEDEESEESEEESSEEEEATPAAAKPAAAADSDECARRPSPACPTKAQPRAPTQ